MAKRLIDTSFLQSAALLELDNETRLFYLYMICQADDLGFVDTIAQIGKLLGLNEGESYKKVECLVEKGYAIEFQRTRDKIYAGEPNYEEIAKAKNVANVPVIANGGIFTKDDAEKMLQNTGADGVMIARGALERPWIFAELLEKEVNIDKASLINEHIDRLLTKYDNKTVAVTFRKQLCLYIKGERNSAELKQKLFTYKDTKSIKTEIERFFRNQNQLF